MRDDEPKGPRLRPRGLARSLEVGQALGADLARGALDRLIVDRPAAHVRNAEEELEQLEPKLEGPLALWQRETMTMTIRGLLRALGELDPSDAVERVSARLERALLRLRAQDEAEIGPLTARLESGEYGVDDLLRDLAARPSFEGDPFVERLLQIDRVPKAEAARGEEMLHYLASPLDVIRTLACTLEPSDVLFDLGAGLGKVTMLASWLSGARAKGVELDPAYVRHAAERARRMRFDRVEMIAADAREVDFGDGTVFYFFDPFRGEVLDAVLAKIAAVAREHPVRVATRGRSTQVIHAAPWLAPVAQHPNGLALYASIAPGR